MRETLTTATRSAALSATTGYSESAAISKGGVHGGIYGDTNRGSERESTSNPLLEVGFAQTTFDAEGREQRTMNFSRQIHFPGPSSGPLGNSASSGVTIGRGYDMGNRSKSQVISELQSAGVPLVDARSLARAAGLRGEGAREFVRLHRSTAPTLTLEAQKHLFCDLLVPFYTADIQRIFTKPDVISTYGKADWTSLPPAVKEVLFDLRYRGDYTPVTRARLQRALVSNDVRGFKAVLSDRAYWAARGVPARRIEERIRALSVM